MENENFSKEFQIAWELHAKALSVIPSGGGPSGKAPIVAWAEYQKRTPTDDELLDWNNTLHPRLWGIVTGLVSRIVVVDVDTVEAMAIMGALKPHIRTPRGGGHYYFVHPGTWVKTDSAILPSVDIRGDGGFVNVIGGKYEIQIFPASDTVYPWGLLPDVILKAITTPRAPTESLPLSDNHAIPQGQRNATLTSSAGTMQRRGMSAEAIEAALLAENRTRCQPPLSDAEVIGIAKSVSRYEPVTNGNTYIYKYNEPNNEKLDTNLTGNLTGNLTNPQQPLSKRVEEWIKLTGSRWFETPELDRDLGITSTADKNNRLMAVRRLEEKAIIERHPKEAKRFRYINTSLSIIDFKTAVSAGSLPLEWPLRIQKYVNLFPGNLAVVAGATNAGKTALLLNVMYLNNYTFPLPKYYFCSEMGQVELRERLEGFKGMAIEEWDFKAIDRSTDFEDVIVPDALNIVDYLELTEDLYAVNTHLTAITHKLGNGLAIVALQKKEGAKYGRGQEFSAEKCKLYLSMDAGKITIIKGKSWANKKVNPNDLKAEFQIIAGCEFTMTREWERD